MTTRILIAVAAAIAVTTTHAASPWTSFKLGKLNPGPNYSNNIFAVRSDGRFLYSENNDLYSQNVFGSVAKTKVNRGTLAFDPSFIAVRDSSHALLGIGGFGPSGMHEFNPSLPAAAITSSPLATIQNYTAVWWQHPTSGRSGWIIAGANAATKNNLTFVSADGTHTGSITSALSDYSAGLASDASGNVFVALSEAFNSPDVADSETVLKFTGAQIDTAVAAVIAGTPAPLAKGDATSLFKFGSAATIAVDSLNRVWAAGFLTNALELYDPANGKSWTISPEHPALALAGGLPTYQVQTFERNSIPYVAFLANDSFFTSKSDVAYGTAAAKCIVSFGSGSQTIAEGAGTATVTIDISPAPAKKVTVPFTIASTAKQGSDFTIVGNSAVFNAGQTSATITVSIIDDGIDEPNETLTLTLGNATPFDEALVSNARTHTITITDDDERPVFDMQTFVVGRVGSPYVYQVVMQPNAHSLPVTFSATGLPPGLTINKTTGAITGRATMTGEFDQVVVTATNSAGVSVSRGFVIVIDDYPAAAHGRFQGVMDNIGTSTFLGGRLDVTTTTTATYTGRLTLGPQTFPISGLLDTSTANPSFSATVKTVQGTVTLAFSIDAATGEISGSNFKGWRCQTATALVGDHHFSLAHSTADASHPQGKGFGSAVISAYALATVTGRLDDGSVITSSAMLGTSGQLAMLQLLRGNTGVFNGFVTIANDAAHTVSGSPQWFIPAITGASQVLFAITAQGGKYRAVSGSTAALGMVEGSGYDATLTVQDGGIATQNISAIIRPPVLITVAAPTTLSINNVTGAFSGKFKSGALLLSFTGMLIPDAGTPDPFDTVGVGYFIAGTHSGSVTLAPVP